MKRRHCAGIGLLVLCCGAIGAAQPNEAPRTFLGTLSAEITAGRIYDRYHGYVMGARVVVPLFAVPALLSSRESDDLVLLPGIKYGSILIPDDRERSSVQYCAPELSLHYSFLQTRALSAYAGPSAEFIFTNNFNKYKLMSTGAIDLGVAFHIGTNVSFGIEQRWAVVRERTSVTNRADFPSHAFSQAGLVLRFSLPWKSEQDGREAFVRDDDRRRAADTAAEIQRRRSAEAEALRSAQSVRADSLSRELAALTSRLGELELRRRNDSLAQAVIPLDRYDASIIAGDREYRFTKDPFTAGNLVNDAYLKNVLIDILDDGYVWQLSARKDRMADAEKIKRFFTLYNGAFSRRITVVEDERTRLFTLKCLGQAEAAGVQHKTKK